MPQPFEIHYRSIVPGDTPRPLLGMTVTGVNGASGPVYGIVDTGADTTSLPFGYASLMGYTAATLVQETVNQVAGTAIEFRAHQPCTAVVPEIPTVTVELRPLFVQGAQIALWGRQDFMTYFDVVMMESQQKFTITPC